MIRKFLFMVVIALVPFCAIGDVINVIDNGNGSFDIVNGNGTRLGNGMSRDAAEKVAQKYADVGNTVKWSGKNSTGANQLPAGNAPKQLTAGTSSGNAPKQSTTGASSGNAPKQLTAGKPSANLPATTPAGRNLPVPTQPGRNLPAPIESPKPSATPAAPAAGGVNWGGAALGVVGMVLTGKELIDDAKARDRKTTAADLGKSTLAGAGFAASTASVVNAIPVGGQIAYGAAVVAGAVVGASKNAGRMFSETDCDMDPVTGQYACCNISNLTDIVARRVNIGDEMFCDFPQVKKCVQGKKEYTTEQPWLKGRFLDDHWSKTCTTKLCNGYKMPQSGDYQIQLYGSSDSPGSVCWKWECVGGWRRCGDKCITSVELCNGDTPTNVTKPVVVDHKVGDGCVKSDLPRNATAGHYIKSGNKIVCAATACVNGAYLVYKNGNSMGWCTFAKCADGKLDSEIRNGIATVNQHGKSFCVGVADSNEMADDEPVLDTDQNLTYASDDAPVLDTDQNLTYVSDDAPLPAMPIDTRNECERGIDGWVIYNGNCITIAARDEQVTARVRASLDRIEQMRSGLKASVWKTAAGNFNGARLASDSIAGVVVGTVGAVVTSNVVKKNQLKNGFEDIQCTIGGQTVANYGDEFHVGM
ncbi:MAG: hypothetical protein IJ560_02700 [Alphaproteobacteria bacterium]|nr:hypothetical protein [Alphaproteobacteria bacterium]